VRDTTGAVDCATRVPGRPPIIRLLAVRTLGAHPSSSIVPPSDVEGVPLAQQYSRPLYTVPPPQVPVYLQHCRCNKKGKCKNCKDGYKKENVGYGYAMYKKCVYNELPEGMTGSKNWPAKKTYGKYEKGAPSCDPNSDYTALSAGLCYKEPKNNYECQLTACQQKCASGTVECGAGACAADQRQCGQGITDMVAAPLLAIGSVFTFGVAGNVYAYTHSARLYMMPSLEPA
jgi:hypothetical protein